MNSRPVLRHLRGLLLLLPIVALAQVPPPPPPPLGPLPPMPVPAANPLTTAKANLGKVLFWDEQLSSSNTVACGTCHRAEAGGSDPRSADVATGSRHPGRDGVFGTPDDVTGSFGVPLENASGAYVSHSTWGLGRQVTSRFTPSHITAGYSQTSFWDGRATGAFLDPLTGDTLIRAGGALESQAVGPIVSDVEMGHIGRDWPNVVARIQSSQPLALAAFIPADLKAWIANRSYPQLFQEAFGTTAVTPARIAFAIASYERTLLPNQARIDSVIAGTALLTPLQAQGQQLFGQSGCAGCHAGPMFSDGQFHYIGVRPAAEDSGRFVVTRNIGNLGQMKTPSLRNVDLRPSHFHTGRFARLEDVVAFYNRGGDFNAPNKPAVIRPLNLTPQQQAALVAFLRGALTDPRVRDQVFPFDRPSLFSDGEMVPVVTGAGVAGSGGVVPQVIAIEPPLSGNTSFTVGLQRGLGGATATLVIDSSEPPASSVLPSSAALTVQSITLQGSGSGNGFASVPVTIPVDPTLRGRTFHGRWYVADPAAADGVSWSPAFSFRVFGANADGLLAVEPPAPTVPRALRLSPGRPTPFRASTVIAYEVFATERVDLVVYDAMGRTVRTLVNDAVQMPGAYTITWDGRDDAGRNAPSGVYFYRLRSGAEANTMRTVKLD